MSWTFVPAPLLKALTKACAISSKRLVAKLKEAQEDRRDSSGLMGWRQNKQTIVEGPQRKRPWWIHEAFSWDPQGVCSSLRAKMKWTSFYIETQPDILFFFNHLNTRLDQGDGRRGGKKTVAQAIFVDTGQGFSKTNNKHLDTDPGSSTNPKKEKYKEIHKVWCVLLH